MEKNHEIWNVNSNNGFSKVLRKKKQYFSISRKKGTLRRHSLKSGPETWDLGPWDPRPWDPGPWHPGLWDLGRTLGPSDPGPGTLEPWDSGTLGSKTVAGPWKYDPRTLRLAADPTTDCINFICEANFDNKKLGHVCQKRRAWIQK